ncbi:hypothetical protein Pmani_030485 [Petrolisthes manimaculis]|uniref:Uncharacterized protein n=1 Tax=Petrolisthes manimaculis TaxID=1843537 RepID=A0AAE1TVV9_9EUCA|nr:hypothetical protein Pmani_030485 [Petrolisthes manimaculis]
MDREEREGIRSEGGERGEKMSGEGGERRSDIGRGMSGPQSKDVLASHSLTPTQLHLCSSTTPPLITTASTPVITTNFSNRLHLLHFLTHSLFSSTLNPLSLIS